MFLSSIFPQDDNKLENMNKITNVSKFKHANNPKEQHTFQMYQCLGDFHIFLSIILLCFRASYFEFCPA